MVGVKDGKRLGRFFVCSSVVALTMLASGWFAGTALAINIPLKVGNVLVSLGNGQIGQFTPAGTLVSTLNTGATGSEETGMCFD